MCQRTRPPTPPRQGFLRLRDLLRPVARELLLAACEAPRTNRPFLRDSRGGHFVIRVIGKGMSRCFIAWHVKSPGYTSALGDSTHSLGAHNVTHHLWWATTSLNGRHPIPQPWCPANSSAPPPMPPTWQHRRIRPVQVRD